MVSVLGGSAGYSDSSQLATVTVASWLLSQSPATRPNYLKNVLKHFLKNVLNNLARRRFFKTCFKTFFKKNVLKDFE